MQPNFQAHFQPTQEQFEKLTHSLMKACEDMSSMAREHMEAAMKSAEAAGKGAEEIMHSTGSIMKNSFDRGVEVSKTIMAAKSVPEAINTHTEYMKECFDHWVSVASKVSEISARTAQDVMGPITEQTHQSVSKITQKLKSAA